MRYWTNFRNWMKPQKDQEVKQLLETKESDSVDMSVYTGNDFRNTVGLPKQKTRNKTVRVSKTVEFINSACCDLDDALTQERADFKNAVINFFEADKEYLELISVPKASSETHKEVEEVIFINPKNSTDEKR